MVRDGTNHMVRILDTEAPYYVAWYERGKVGGKIVIDRSEAFQAYRSLEGICANAIYDFSGNVLNRQGALSDSLWLKLD